MNAWAKPDAHLICGDCGEAMEAEERSRGRIDRHRAGFLRRAVSFARHQRSTSRKVIRLISVALSLVKSAGAGCSQIQGI